MEDSNEDQEDDSQGEEDEAVDEDDDYDDEEMGDEEYGWEDEGEPEVFVLGDNLGHGARAVNQPRDILQRPRGAHGIP